MNKKSILKIIFIVFLAIILINLFSSNIITTIKSSPKGMSVYSVILIGLAMCVFNGDKEKSDIIVDEIE